MEKNSAVTSGFRRYIFLAVITAALFCAPFSPAAEGAGDPNQVTLDAERVTYDDESAKAYAEGNAVMTYQGAVIYADRVDYDAVSQRVSASANPGGSVLLEDAGRKVTGDGLEYDLNTKTGVMSGVRSEFDVGNGTLYLTGDEMRLMPYEEALARGIVSGRAGDGSNPAHAGFAENVIITTCAQDHPHYRIESKRVIFIPGRRVIAKRPRLYLGDTFIFTYPMDYVVRIDRKALSHNFVPYIESGGDKGTGAGISGGFEWETGAVDLGLSFWSETGAEWMLGVRQDLGGGFSFQGGVEYIWNEAWNEHEYSPGAALLYARDGWEASLRFSWSEYQEIQKTVSDPKYRGRLDRTPELNVFTPWVRDPFLNLSWFRFGFTAGGYWERIPAESYDRVNRYGATLQNYFEYPLGRDVTFFSNLIYGAWSYDQGDSDQKSLYGITGFYYSLGAVELASGYEQRGVWGWSPMTWDRYEDTKRLHQKIRFPLGKEWYLAVRASYDIDADMLYEMNYALQWITDCMKWELRFNDDRSSGSNTSIALSLSILAYPNTPLSFGQSVNNDPFPGRMP